MAISIRRVCTQFACSELEQVAGLAILWRVTETEAASQPRIRAIIYARRKSALGRICVGARYEMTGGAGWARARNSCAP
jgi:hypothetical protein